MDVMHVRGKILLMNTKVVLQRYICDYFIFIGYI